MMQITPCLGAAGQSSSAVPRSIGPMKRIGLWLVSPSVRALAVRLLLVAATAVLSDPELAVAVGGAAEGRVGLLLANRR